MVLAGDPSRALRRREIAAQSERQSSASARDIGSIPPIADVARRNSCRKSLRLFCETYNPAPFYLSWSEDHLRVIAAIERSVTGGFLQAFAMPRGSGKTTLCRMAVLWAASYALTPYPFLIGATADKAQDGLEAIKTWMRYLPEYAEDFPEISKPAIALAGIANRQSGQTCEGESTGIRWEKDRLVLPRVPKPKNLKHKGKYAPTSGLVIGCSGLTGEGLRGSLFTLTTGEQVRPSLVLIDDPQTDESAGSPSQNESRYNLLTGAVLGMAGPGKTISGVMPCTVIRNGDMADRVLDRKKNPLWRGIRTSLLRSMPKNLGAWEKYFEVYREALGRDEPDIASANAHYCAHREVLDEGAEAAWLDRKLDNEVSAIQHAMNLYARDKAAFFAEYQNQPLDAEDNSNAPRFKPASMPLKMNGMIRGVVPLSASTLTAYVDVHAEILYWMVLSWQDNFTPHVVDYGTYPKQPSAYFEQRNPPLPLSAVHAGESTPAIVLAGLTALVPSLLSRDFVREDKGVMRIARAAVDSAWETETVRAYCRRSGHGETLMPARGYYLKPGASWRTTFANKPGGRTGHHWRVPPAEDGMRYVLFDADGLKTLACSSIDKASGDPGSLTLFSRNQNDAMFGRILHDLLFHHWCGEYAEWRQFGDGGKWHWEKKPNHDQHWLDTLAGNFGVALLHGVQVPGLEMQVKRTRVKLSELQRMKA